MEPTSLVWTAAEGTLFPATSGPWTIDVPYLYDLDQPHLSLFYNNETIATKLTIVAAKVLAQRIETTIPSFSKQVSVVGALFEELSHAVPDDQTTLSRTTFVSGRRQGLKDAIRIVTEKASSSPLTSPNDDADQYDLELIEDRDIAQDWADRLAGALAPPDVIGEHSSSNNPWANALDYALNNSVALPIVDLRQLQEEVSQWQRLQFRPHGESPNALIDGLKLCEEAGEIARALLKRHTSVAEKQMWEENLREELGDLFISALGLSANEGFLLADILATRWHQVSQRNYRNDTI
jgi:NTP pyrophosphatase (non-canonical NTP hydrolase)